MRRQDYVAVDGRWELAGVSVFEACQGGPDGPTAEAVQAAKNGQIPASHRRVHGGLFATQGMVPSLLLLKHSFAGIPDGLPLSVWRLIIFFPEIQGGSLLKTHSFCTP